MLYDSVTGRTAGKKVRLKITRMCRFFSREFVPKRPKLFDRRAELCDSARVPQQNASEWRIT